MLLVGWGRVHQQQSPKTNNFKNLANPTHKHPVFAMRCKFQVDVGYLWWQGGFI